MPTSETTLTPLSIVTPSLPDGVYTISIDASVLPLVIDADTNTTEIDVVVGSTEQTLTAFSTANGVRRFLGTIEVEPIQSLQVVRITGRGANAVTPTIAFDLLYSPSVGLSLWFAPPSGTTIYNGSGTCRVEWAIPNYQGFLGVRVRYSTDASGVTVPYQQYGDIQTQPTRSAEVVLSGPSIATSLTENPVSGGQLMATNTLTTVEQQTTITTNYGSINIPSGAVNADVFFVTLTALFEDPVTNQVYETQASGPFTCGFVNLAKVNPTDFLALQQANDIALRMITEVTRRRPDLDLTARSEVRDIIINPLALELANMSVREWFSRCCQSISALAALDDANGDGISDTVQGSSAKQQLARAYGLGNAALQSFIDSRFDILGEQAGVPRGGATNAVARVTFYTYSLPTSLITIPEGGVCATTPTSVSPTSMTFTTRASAVIDPRSAASYYDPQNGWWGVSVPVEAQVAGAAGNVGATTITQVMGGISSGVAVTNLNAAQGGSDQQSNADYAAMIQNRQVVGKDSGTRSGYWTAARGIPGVIDALVVAAGDEDMLRDWSSQLGKHTFGCVDVYVQSGVTSQQVESVPFSLPNPSTYLNYATYLTCKAPIISTYGLPVPVISFAVNKFNTLPAPLYTAVEMTATNAGTTIWLGVANAQFDNTRGTIFLDPGENPYVVNADGTQSPWKIGGQATTNFQFLQAALGANVTYRLMAQLQDGISHVPALQPVTAIDSVSGTGTGVIPIADTTLVYTSDFLLTGGSAQAGDTVTVSGEITTAVSKPLTLATALTPLDTDISVTVDSTGNPGTIISLQNAATTFPYVAGTDYTIVPNGRYRSYAIKVLNDPATGSPRIPAGTGVIANYYQFLLREQLTFQSEQITFSGSAASPLSSKGFVRNVWQPVAHGLTTLYCDGAPVAGQPATGLMGAGVAPQSRYIKVALSDGYVLTEGNDFTLTVDPATGQASITPIGSGWNLRTVSVSYFTLEVFTVATEYPASVAQLTTALAATKHAGADTLVKSMVASPVDLVLSVTLNRATTPDAVDGVIRSACDLAVSSAQTELDQSILVSRVRGVTGVTSVALPLTRCAKADGSYNIGEVIPTGTSWLPLGSDPKFLSVTNPTVYISETTLLSDPTIPSGGTSNGYVGLLYEGQAYRRAASVEDFLAGATPSFYIIGTDDRISGEVLLPANYSRRILLAPGDASDPSLRAYRCTYMVFGAATASNITVASSEYLTVGSVTINYVLGS